jgi:hypothetical protein
MPINKIMEMPYPPAVYVYASGAGAGIQKKIWETPGCSSILVGSGFPYDMDETANVLGFVPDKFVSEDAAMQLAMAAYMKACRSDRLAIGIGMTCSVASTREHRGDHRIIVSSFSDLECLSFSVTIPKGVGLHQRLVDGLLADELGLAALSRAAGFNPESIGYRSKSVASTGGYLGHADTLLEYNPENTTEKAKALILQNPLFCKDGTRDVSRASEYLDTDHVIFYPGSFNPLHIGHVNGSDMMRMAAAKKFGELREIVFCTTVNPSHKEPLSPAQMLRRATQIKNRNFLLTENDPLFVDKAEKYPGGWFGIGTDALISMLDPKWGVSTEDVLLKLNWHKIKMFVLGRLVDGNFMTLSDVMNKIPILKQFEDLFVEVPGRWDISSTELRNKK